MEPFNSLEKFIILDALDIKLASIRRAMNTNKNPKFLELYQAEWADTNAVKNVIMAIAVANPGEPKRGK